MFGVFFRMMKDKFNTMLIYSLSSIAFLEMYIATFPYVQKQADSFNQMVKSLPKEMFSALGIDPSQLSYSNLQSYLATEMFSFMWPILAIIFCTSLANYSIAGEIEKGDIELTLAQPVSRTKIYLSRYFAALAIFTVFAFFSIVAIFPLAKFHEIAYEAEKYYKLGFASFLLGFAILGFAFFASSLVSERGKSSFIVGGTLILMYVMNILAGLKDSLKNLQYLSFFHYYNGTTLLVKNEYVQYSVPVLLGVGIVFLILGLLSFNKRDIAV